MLEPRGRKVRRVCAAGTAPSPAHRARPADPWGRRGWKGRLGERETWDRPAHAVLQAHRAPEVKLDPLACRVIGDRLDKPDPSESRVPSDHRVRRAIPDLLVLSG